MILKNGCWERELCIGGLSMNEVDKLQKIEKDINALLEMLDELNKYLVALNELNHNVVDMMYAKFTTDTSSKYAKMGW